MLAKMHLLFSLHTRQYSGQFKAWIKKCTELHDRCYTFLGTLKKEEADEASSFACRSDAAAERPISAAVSRVSGLPVHRVVEPGGQQQRSNRPEPGAQGRRPPPVQLEDPHPVQAGKIQEPDPPGKCSNRVPLPPVPVGHSQAPHPLLPCPQAGDHVTVLPQGTNDARKQFICTVRAFMVEQSLDQDVLNVREQKGEGHIINCGFVVVQFLPHEIYGLKPRESRSRGQRTQEENGDEERQEDFQPVYIVIKIGELESSVGQAEVDEYVKTEMLRFPASLQVEFEGKSRVSSQEGVYEVSKEAGYTFPGCPLVKILDGNGQPVTSLQRNPWLPSGSTSRGAKERFAVQWRLVFQPTGAAEASKRVQTRTKAKELEQAEVRLRPVAFGSRPRSDNGAPHCPQVEVAIGASKEADSFAIPSKLLDKAGTYTLTLIATNEGNTRERTWEGLRMAGPTDVLRPRPGGVPVLQEALLAAR